MIPHMVLWTGLQYYIAYAYSKVKNVISELNAIRANEQLLHDWYIQAEKLASDIDVQPEAPRTVSCQQGRENVEHNSPEEFTEG